MTDRLCRLERIRRYGIIHDTSVIEVIPDILGHHEGVVKQAVLHIRGTGEDGIRIIIVSYYTRVSTCVVVVACRD